MLKQLTELGNRQTGGNNNKGLSPGERNESMMRVTREAGVCNAGQLGDLESHGGRAGAGVTLDV